MNDFDPALARAAELARGYLESLPTRPVWARASYEDILERVTQPLQDEPIAPDEVVDELADWVEPGLTATPSGRFYGFVIGGVVPAALAADWLTSTWDQNAGLNSVAPAAAAAETVAGGWLLARLGWPALAAVGYVTGGTVANYACLASARHTVLDRAGWDVNRQGLFGAPPVRILVGADRHGTIDSAVRYLGLGLDSIVVIPADDQGRIDAEALAAELAQVDTPTIVCLQAGEIHTGAFDPFPAAIEAAHAAGAWVHVDGAFGLWARANESTRRLADGVDAADSWATDAHKTLNVPYDCGLAIVRDRDALASSMAMHGEYLIEAGGDPQERVPELSRRGRGFASWAALRSLGRTGVVDLVERLASHARAFAEGAVAIPGVEVLNDVVFTQVCLAFGDDDRTRAVAARLLEDGTTWMSGSRWHDRAIVRISVSNWSTTEDDVRRSLEALSRAAESVHA